eukprot:UN09614
MLADIRSINKKIEYKFINANEELYLSNSKKNSENKLVLFESLSKGEVDVEKRQNNRTVTISSKDDLKNMEKNFVSAILAVTQKKKSIYFTEGHQEREFTT